MELTVKLKPGATFTNLSTCDAQEIAAALCISLPDSLRLVHYGEKAPLDTTLAWQPTDCCARPIGRVLQYEEGEWK